MRLDDQTVGRASEKTRSPSGDQVDTYRGYFGCPSFLSSVAGSFLSSVAGSFLSSVAGSFFVSFLSSVLS